MEQTASVFETFSSGSHLIIGEAGAGKTRFMWAVLQREDFGGNAINIVLTDSQKNVWYRPSRNLITTLDPYCLDISWVSSPSRPGIYYCACEYIPRIITFLECLATWAIQSEKDTESSSQTVRIFLDFSSKHWVLPEFVEQVARLHYISSTRGEDHAHPIELWISQGLSAKVPTKVRSFFSAFHQILLNPTPAPWIQEIPSWLGTPSPATECLSGLDPSIKDGFYYAPQTGLLALSPHAIEI